MPIRDFPFISITSDNHPRPWVPIVISNPQKGLSFSTYGLIDTGADECCVPSEIADILGHVLKRGATKGIAGAGGATKAYSHTTKIEILDHHGENVYTINDTCIDFVIGLHVVLLGVKQFLDHFKLNIDYPVKKFSIMFPR